MESVVVQIGRRGNETGGSGASRGTKAEEEERI